MAVYELAHVMLRAAGWPVEWESYAFAELGDSKEGAGERQTITVCYGGATRKRSELTVDLQEGGLRLEGLGFEAQYDRKAAELTLRADPGLAPQLTLGNTLRAWLCSILPLERDGLMVHAASCVLHGKGLIFPGVSTAGKTTFSDGLVEARYLSDDISLLDRIGAEPRLLASPFHGVSTRQGERHVSAPLAAVGLLSHGGGHTTLERVSGSEAVSKLMRHVVCFSRDRATLVAVLRLATQLVERVPIFEVRRSLSDSSDDICRRLLEEAGA